MNLKIEIMKKGVLTGYALVAAIAFLMQSCVDDPILPNGGCGGGIDTTWVNDSTGNNGDPNGGGNGTPDDSTYWGGGNGTDSTDWNGGDPSGGGNGGGSTGDTTIWNGGNGDPTDTIGGN
jgi:hypothetical protein